MKNILLGILLSFALISLTACMGSENDSSTRKNKCQSGLCGGGKCDHGKKDEIKKSEIPKSDKSTNKSK